MNNLNPTDIITINNGALQFNLPNIPHEEDTFYIACPYGIGDTLYVAALVKSYRVLHPEIKKVTLIVKESHSYIPLWFPAVDETLISDQLVSLLNYFSVSTQTWRLKNYIYGHFKKNLNSDLFPEYHQIIPNTMISRYKQLVMQVPEHCPLEPIRFPFKLTANEHFNKHTIILMPHAASTGELPMVFWETLAGYFLRAGLTVFTNIKDETEAVIPGTVPLSENIETTALICEQCLAVISYRSGMCDVLALTNTLLCIINPFNGEADAWNVQHATSREGIINFYAEDSYHTLAPILEKILYLFQITP